MLVRDTRRPLAALMATCLALAIVASALAACSGSPDERPAPGRDGERPPPRSRPGHPRPRRSLLPRRPGRPRLRRSRQPRQRRSRQPRQRRSRLSRRPRTPSPPPTAAPTPTATPTPTDEAAPAETPSATAFRYDRLDATGAVATAGSYAFLVPDGEATSVVTTYEQLRTEATVMRVNVADAHGASWAGFYDTVAVGDVVAWYEADDCWTRYRTTSTPEPVAGSSMREFGVEWFAYAGTGCAGAISTAATVEHSVGSAGYCNARHRLSRGHPHPFARPLRTVSPDPLWLEGRTRAVPGVVAGIPGVRELDGPVARVAVERP